MKSQLISLIKKNKLFLHLLRWRNATKRPAVIILRYHSIQKDIENTASFMGTICHEAEVFAEHMRILSQEFDPVSMDEIHAMACGRLAIPKRGVAVTFDDGFADNCEIAMPIMDSHGVKGTVYVTTGYVESGAPLWFMRLRHAFHESAVIALEMNGNTHALTDPLSRRQAFLEASAHLARLTGERQDAALLGIENQLEIEPLVAEDRVILSWEQMRRMVRNGHLIGVHTQSHPNVAHINPEELRSELIDSKQYAEEHIGVQVEHFSYPKPILRPYFNEATQKILRDSGFKTVATCEAGVYCGGEALCLPRIIVPLSVQGFRWDLEMTKFRHTR